MSGHRQDESADRLRIGAVERLAHQRQESEQLRCFLAQILELRHPWHRLLEFGQNPLEPFRTPWLRLRLARPDIQLGIELTQYAVDHRRILPKVETHRPEAEDLNFPAHRPDNVARDRTGIDLAQCFFGLGNFARKLGWISKWLGIA